MIKKILIVLFLPIIINAQWDATAAMGINLTNMTDLSNYVNLRGGSDEMKEFNTAAEFLTEVNYDFNKNYSVGLGFAYEIYSFSTEVRTAGNYQIDYYFYKPSLLLYYMIPGEGYKFKFGGGLGYRYVQFDEKVPYFLDSESYSASGLGFVLKAKGYTILSGDFYAFISVNYRYDMTSELEGNGVELYNSVDDENVDLTTSSLGLKLGVSFFF